MTMDEIQEVLNTLMRAIDRKTTLTVEPIPDAETPAVIVQLRRDKRTGSLQLTEADLYAAQSDLVRRSQVRTALKRARDRMWEEIRPIFSTKVAHEKGAGATWSHPAQRARGGRR